MPQANQSNPNRVRGEITETIGDLTLHLIPSFERIAKAETTIGMSMFDVANGMVVGRSLTMNQICALFECLAKPRPKRAEIGKALMGRYDRALVIVGKICEVALKTDDDADDDDVQDPDEDTEGN